MNAQTQQIKQNDDVLGQRLAKAEDTNAQLQGELSVVTDKMKLTEDELRKHAPRPKRSRKTTPRNWRNCRIRRNAQLATKASVDDVNKLGTDVTGVKTDLDTDKNNLQMARGEFGTLIAKNHDEIEELRRLGERDYYEFTIDKKNSREKVGDLMVELQGSTPKKNHVQRDDLRRRPALRQEEPVGQRADLFLHARHARSDGIHGEPGGQGQNQRLPERAEGEFHSRAGFRRN